VTTTRTPLARQVAARARRDSAFARVLDVLLDAPTAPQGTLERIAARKLNYERRATLTQEFVEGAMPTPEVQTLLGLRTPQAVHRLRSRGQLLGQSDLVPGLAIRRRPFANGSPADSRTARAIHF
jgi:hypothetical protein